MKHWKDRILQMKFGKAVKRLAILSVCVVLLGGILTAGLLQPQISQITSAVQQAEQMEGFHEEYFHDWEGWDDTYRITEPSLPVKGALLAIGAAFCALFAAWWLLAPAWLYQAAKQSRMNPLLWPLLGLVWSILAVFLFLIIRSFVRQRCDACGTWQKKASYCLACGKKFYVTCPACGEECDRGSSYCPKCGTALPEQSPSSSAAETR